MGNTSYDSARQWGRVIIFEDRFTQAKVGIFGFAVSCKKLLDHQNLIETPKYVYLLNTVQGEVKLIL